MKSDKEAKIVALIIVIMSIFFFYTAYNSKDMANRLGFTVIGVWAIYNVFGSYIRQYIMKVLKRNDGQKGDMR